MACMGAVYGISPYGNPLPNFFGPLFGQNCFTKNFLNFFLQNCYLVSKVPKGKWYCEPCAAQVHAKTDLSSDDVQCRLCLNYGGALFRGTDGGWAHCLCAMWVPETGYKNSTNQVEGIKRAVRDRGVLKCRVCNVTGGAPIQCFNQKCYASGAHMCMRLFEPASLVVRTCARADAHADARPDLIEARSLGMSK